jgi:hypothetical protein
MPRPARLLLCVALGLLFVLPASAEAKRKRRRGPAVAVWDVYVDDDNRSEAWRWYSRISDAIDTLPDLRADDELDFEPDARPAEGITVAVSTASRWLEASWALYRGREYDDAITFCEEALRLVEGYPAARMPDGMLRDLELMVARASLARGSEARARRSLRAAVLLDPSWEARPGWELPDFVALWEEVAAERSTAPQGTVVVRSSEPLTRVLVYGVDQGVTSVAGELELPLPPGIYEVTGRRPGFADVTERIHLKPHDLVEVELTMEVRNSASFQEELVRALADPTGQRGATVWTGLRAATDVVGAEGILVARYDAAAEDRHGALQVGLYQPGRQGWGFYRIAELSGDQLLDEAAVDALIDELLLAIETARAPLTVATGAESDPD